MSEHYQPQQTPFETIRNNSSLAVLGVGAALLSPFVAAELNNDNKALAQGDTQQPYYDPNSGLQPGQGCEELIVLRTESALPNVKDLLLADRQCELDTHPGFDASASPSPDSLLQTLSGSKTLAHDQITSVRYRFASNMKSVKLKVYKKASGDSVMVADQTDPATGQKAQAIRHVSGNLVYTQRDRVQAMTMRYGKGLVKASVRKSIPDKEGKTLDSLYKPVSDMSQEGVDLPPVTLKLKLKGVTKAALKKGVRLNFVQSSTPKPGIPGISADTDRLTAKLKKKSGTVRLSRYTNPSTPQSGPAIDITRPNPVFPPTDEVIDGAGRFNGNQEFEQRHADLCKVVAYDSNVGAVYFNPTNESRSVRVSFELDSFEDCNGYGKLEHTYSVSSARPSSTDFSEGPRYVMRDHRDFDSSIKMGITTPCRDGQSVKLRLNETNHYTHMDGSSFSRKSTTPARTISC